MEEVGGKLEKGQMLKRCWPEFGEMLVGNWREVRSQTIHILERCLSEVADHQKLEKCWSEIGEEMLRCLVSPEQPRRQKQILRQALPSWLQHCEQTAAGTEKPDLCPPQTSPCTCTVKKKNKTEEQNEPSLK